MWWHLSRGTGLKVCFTSADHNRPSGKSRSQLLFWSFICVWGLWIKRRARSFWESGLVKVFQVTDKDRRCQFNDLKSWKSFHHFCWGLKSNSQPGSLICCLTLRFLPVCFHEVNYPGSLKERTGAELLLVWINTARVRLQKFFVQWSHHWRCYFLFCFSVNLSHSRQHLSRFTGFRCALHVIS